MSSNIITQVRRVESGIVDGTYDRQRLALQELVMKSNSLTNDEVNEVLKLKTKVETENKAQRDSQLTDLLSPDALKNVYKIHIDNQAGDLTITLGKYRETLANPNQRAVGADIPRLRDTALREAEELRQSWIDAGLSKAEIESKTRMMASQLELAGMKINETTSIGSAIKEAIAQKTDEQKKEILGRDVLAVAAGLTGATTSFTKPPQAKNVVDDKPRGPSDQILKLNGATLKMGDEGEKVKILQENLTKLGFKVDPDGVYGSQTYEAVKAFQASKNIDVDGIVGTQTSDALDRAVSGQVIGSVVQATGKIKDDVFAAAGKLGDETQKIASGFGSTLSNSLAGVFGTTPIALAGDAPRTIPTSVPYNNSKVDKIGMS